MSYISKLILVVIAFVFICSFSDSYAQGRRDLGKGQYVYYGNDSTKGKKDSVKVVVDSTKLFLGDSLSRIKYFAYFPEYSFKTYIREKQSDLVLKNPSLIKRDFKIVDTLIKSSDTTKPAIRQTQIIISEYFNNDLIKTPCVLPLNEYLKKQESFARKAVFEQLFSDKYRGQTTDDISRLFEKFTDITIPLPFKTETIFGPPTINLRINGTVDITASYQSVTSDQVVLSSYNTNQNNINFKQDLQITAKGSVGDKLTIDADWNTQRTFDFENQLKIKYTGYADEVIQSIEAGNVTLDTRSSLIQSSQALFGIKGLFKLGPLSVSTVFSQKKSKQEQKDYSGGVAQQDFAIDVWNYSESHYFLDTLYKSSFIDFYNTTTNVYQQSTIDNQILKNARLQVWVQTDITDNRKRPAVSYTMLQDSLSIRYDTLINTNGDPGLRFFGFFRQLQQNEYYLNEMAGFLSLKINLPDNYHVGVTYTTSSGKVYGYSSLEKPSNNDTLVLKMVKCANQSPRTETDPGTPLAWELKMKNIYRLPVTRVIQEGFKCDVMYNDNNVWVQNITLSGQQKSLSQITGVDRYTNPSKSPPPDNIFDFLPGYTINTETGDIIFPYLRPFADPLISAGADSTLAFKDLYTKRKSEVQNTNLATKYSLRGTAKGEAGISNTINLGFNVVQGSVIVMFGSQKLAENIDYSVDYSTGTVVIRNAQALISKDLKITYETNDLFSLASKTFIGARADYKINEKTNFGFTFVNLKQETLNDKVRIGEEPTNNSMFGFDFTTEFKPKLITSLVNLLPGYNTKEESLVNFKSEFALLTPDPNTKKSVIPQDNGESVAYIDDMEGAKKIISLGSSYAQWSISSHPVSDLIGDSVNIRQAKRGKMEWYNVPNGVSVKDIYPLRDVQAGQENITPFYIDFNPNTRGTYNYYDKHFDTTTKTTNWNGIMKYLNTTSTDLLNENINYIEFNMKVENVNSANLSPAKIYIDLGTISEDAIPAYNLQNPKVPIWGTLNTEDKNSNGILDPNEDLGLDSLTNDMEMIIYNAINDTNLTLAQVPDPALDDNSSDQIVRYDKINGTQNNQYFEGGNRPDSEDLNHNGTCDTYNAYFEYEVPMDTTGNKLISGKGAPGSGWFQYRIPISEFKRMINNPTLTNVEYIRVWISGLNQEVRISLVDFNLVGNQWIKPNKNDTTYNISVVSIEENSQIYQSPVPGDVLRQTVRNTNGANTKSNEGSLSLQVNRLTNGQRKTAVKDYKTQPIDIFNYKTMKLFVNGDPTFNYTNERNYDAAMVVRFGSDSNNYYEYRAPVHPDVRPGSPWNSQNEITIVFADLTTLKIARDSTNQLSELPVPNGPPGSLYRIKGNPSLSSIRIIELGVEKNKTGPNSIISGSVWFNEIRLLKVNNDNGYAYTINTSIKGADLFTVNFNLSTTDPNFHSIDTRVGSRNTGRNWDVGGSFNIHKIVNNIFANWFGAEWKEFLTLPITVRHSEGLINPQYYPGTDIQIDQASQQKFNQVLAKTGDPAKAQLASDNIRSEAQTLTTSDEFTINGLAFRFPGNNYFVKTFLNAFTINFSGQNGTFRDYSYEYRTSFTYSGALNFNTDFGLAHKWNLDINKIINLGEQYKDAKIYLFIPIIPLVPLFSNSFTASVDYNRSRSEQKQRRLNDIDPVSRVFTSNRGFSFNWKFIENWIVDLTGNYQIRISSDLVGFETNNDSAKSQRSGKQILNEIFFNESLINFGKDLNYQQSTTFNPKINLPYLNRFFDITLSYGVNYGWQNPNSTANIGYNTGFANNLNSNGIIKIGELFKLIEPSDSPNSKFSGAKSNTITSNGNPGLGDVLKFLKGFIPDAINVTFQQNNNVSNAGVFGRPGFTNFWLPFLYKENYGPNIWYQLGLEDDPGRRIPGLYLTDSKNQGNSITLSGQITPLLPNNLRINLTFKRTFGTQKSSTFISDVDGLGKLPQNGSYSNSNAISIFLIGNIDNFRYTSSANPSENISSISDAFKSSLSSIPFPNWSMTLSGLEQLAFFSEFASSVSIENTLVTEYSESSSSDPSGLMIPGNLKVSQSFNPFIGLNITFKTFLGGNFSANFRINSSKIYTLNPSSTIIDVQNTSDWALNANFTKTGFELPFFGLSLKNDIAFALAVSRNTNTPLTYKFNSGSDTPEKVPGSGSTILTINPSIQYSLSSKVQMQLFFKYVKTDPVDNTANVIPRTNKEGGLNIRININ